MSSHLNEVCEMVRVVYREQAPLNVILQGESLTIAEVTAVARCPDSVVVTLNSEAAKSRVDRCVRWLTEESTKKEGNLDVYAITTGFGAHADRRTGHLSKLQTELIRYLNAGVIGNNPSNVMPPHAVRATMLVRANCLLQGYSGVRWGILEALVQLINSNVTPRVPLRGSITASGDLMPLAYVAAVLTGRSDSQALTGAGGVVVSGREALKLAGVEEGPFVLRAKEGIALVNGTSAGAALASVVCFDANVLLVLAEVLTAMFCEVMHAHMEFVDPLIHELKGHPGQTEAASVMRQILGSSDFMVRAAELSGVNRLSKLRQDRYAIRTSPQWLGPQIEAVQAATRCVEREVNSVNDNPLIDVDRARILHCGNFQGAHVGSAMDSVRIALAAVGKLVFAQFSELVNAGFNNGLPANLSAADDPSLDYGFACMEIAMAAYISELSYLANPVTTHVHAAEHHNQSVNSLGLVSARKSEEAVEVLKIMLTTFLLAVCQAIDLRHLEAALLAGVKGAVSAAASRYFSATCTQAMVGEVEKLYVFGYIGESSSSSSLLINKLREVFLSSDHEVDGIGSKSFSFAQFDEELKALLKEVNVKTRAEFEESLERGMIEKCASHPLYDFVRNVLGTGLLIGGGSEGTAPKQHLDKIYNAMSDGSLFKPLFKCLNIEI